MSVPDAWDECAACGHDRDDHVFDRAGCVRPAGIDRDAVYRTLEDLGLPEHWIVAVTDAVLALVRPVAGVTLDRDEAAALTRVLAALRRPGGVSIADLPIPVEMERLAARLEAAS